MVVEGDPFENLMQFINKVKPVSMGFAKKEVAKKPQKEEPKLDPTMF